jgi:hypothetical protein
VALYELKLNKGLVTYLRRCEQEDVEALSDPPGDRLCRPWAVKRKLSEADIQTIVAEFLAGTPRHVLAARYSVRLGGLKSLLRRRGRYDDGGGAGKPAGRAARRLGEGPFAGG